MDPNRYQAERLLRSGGVAELWEARASGPDGFTRVVALKILRGSAPPDVRTEFFDEARIGALFRHPNVVPVLDFGAWEDGSYQVLELVDGLDLDAAVTRAQGLSLGVPEAVGLRIVRDAAIGLDYIHNLAGEKGPLGIVHRDISPGNILVSWDGTTRVSDFGAATSSRRSTATLPGLVKGTPSFMAPEQWVGNAATRRTDVFALGCVLHWLLAGASPIKGREIRTRVLRGQPVPIAESIAPDIREVLERALAAESKRRLASCEELAERCDRLLFARGDRRMKSALLEWLGAMRPSPASAHPIESLFMLDAGGSADAALEVASRPGDAAGGEKA